MIIIILLTPLVVLPLAMEDAFRGVGSFHKSENEFIQAGVDLFAKPTVELSSRFCRESVHRPISENPEGPFEFFLPSENETYIDPEGFRLEGYVYLVKGDGSEEKGLDNNDKTAPISMIPITAWSMKELFINGYLVNYVTQPYENIKAYIENELSYGSDIKNTILSTTSLYKAETLGKMDDLVNNTVFLTENCPKWIDKKKHAFSVPLQLDVLSTERFLPNKMDLNIRLTKAPDSLLCMSTNETTRAKVRFYDLKLISRRVTLDKKILMDHSSRFGGGQEAIIPFVRTDIKTYTLSTGVLESRTNSIYRKKIPNSAIICFVDNSAISGSYKLNPLNFQNFNIAEVAFYCNSEKICSYKQDYSKSDYAISYRRFMDEIGVKTNNIGNNIKAERWAKELNLYAFDFSPDKCQGFHDHVAMSGNLDFVVRFKETTPKPITMLIITHYDDTILLDEARNVINRHDPIAIA